MNKKQQLAVLLQGYKDAQEQEKQFREKTDELRKKIMAVMGYVASQPGSEKKCVSDKVNGMFVSITEQDRSSLSIEVARRAFGDAVEPLIKVTRYPVLRVS